MPKDPARPECWLLDLDGVLWLGDEPIAHAADAVQELRASGRKVAFFTNNSFVSRRELLEKLARHGIVGIDPALVFSSAQTAAGLCRANEHVFVLGGEGITEALVAAGVQVVTADELSRRVVEVVIVGFDPQFDYARLALACRAVWDGARLIGTNEDATYPTPNGPIPGGGAIVAAVAYATGTRPVIAGKPHPPAVELLRARLGQVDVMVGDRPSTDGVLAARLGARFGLVRSGVTGPDEPLLGPVPDADAPDLAGILRALAHRS